MVKVIKISDAIGLRIDTNVEGEEEFTFYLDTVNKTYSNIFLTEEEIIKAGTILSNKKTRKLFEKNE